MTPKVYIIDTNVIVSGLIGADSNSPPARILNAMLDGELLYLMSDNLLNEYSSVLHRPRLVREHDRSDEELGQLLTELAANAIWLEPTVTGDAPDAGDNHLWALLASRSRGQLITGDRLLLENPPSSASVISPRDFVDMLFSPK